MRAAVLAAAIALGVAAPAQAAPMDYWQYVATYPTAQACHTYAREEQPWGVDYYVCDPKNNAWDLYWVFLTRT
ncbi:hypothetical protein Q5530_07570 [Saccharothrix sp. BKS2]|uniref:hypothetical protein n=1 Tax=Saccharothrix sp. BKS2 TaxID=3064400 RepID=UPI0039E9D7E1